MDGQTDRRTDRQTENTICRAAWSLLKMYIVLWSRRALCAMIFYMLAIATEITLSVMSFNVRTTFQVQAACPLDNSTDPQAVSVYKHYKLKDIPLSPPDDWELEVKSEPCKMHGPSGDVL